MIKYKLINNEYEVNGCETDAINVIIPKTHLGKKITSIDNYSFYNCTSLTNISIPASVKSIGYNTFENCTSLTSITIPNRVTRIDNGAFCNCTSLTSITIPDGIESIDNYSFCNCASLTNISIPASVKSIGDSAFWNCTSLIAKSGNYKAFNNDMRCREFQYEEGKTYTLDGTLKLCKKGFHYVTNLYEVFNYYSGKLQEGPIICEVEPLGNIEKNNEDSKCCTDKIKIGRRLSTQEIINVLNKKEI